MNAYVQLAIILLVLTVKIGKVSNIHRKGVFQTISNRNSSRDECAIESTCPKNHACQNTDGSYFCECIEGYEFRAEYNNCLDIGRVSDF